MSFLTSLFCDHSWISHEKREVTKETYYPLGDSEEYKPTGLKKVFTREVLICKHCGKIKIIEY